MRLIYKQFIISFLIIIAGSSLLIINIGCSKKQTGNDKIKTIVSIPPQEFFVRKIADTLVGISVLIPVGQSPTTYNPTPQQMIDIESANLFFTIGVPFEKHLLKKLNTNGYKTKIINTQTSVDLIPISELDHDHGNLDPHIWIDPQLVKTQATNITNALIKYSPEHKEIFNNNLELFKHELDSIDILISGMFAKFNKRHLCAFHPSFGYFCKAYGLVQVAIELDGKEPSAKHLAEFVKMAQEENINTIFIQPQFSDKSARVIAESINAKVETIDPLSSDYLNNLADMAEKIAASFDKN